MTTEPRDPLSPFVPVCVVLMAFAGGICSMSGELWSELLSVGLASVAGWHATYRLEYRP